MSRNGALALAVSAVVLVLVVYWATVEPPPAPSWRAGAPTAAVLEDLIVALQVVPLDGQPATPFTLPTHTGERFDLADLAGQPVLLYFWATW